MKKVLILLGILAPCSQVKKENRNELMAKITYSISKDIELKARTKTKSITQ
ncbi:hypothetical protein [Capnocytophaga catalasegens]|uniref:Lipoprotein n=1 Tax=Capnocytophaga catalasegens TaxID=1004260 RepID=A0AAV5AVG1_9FLAO|nr:hypothetical protein [Capnocytophaga catalasegens]GIZ14285.1 hypothetical protein RCZ03_02860 [Capnocytophaga catalasegens]GJM51282.1 hypothetical protein RCZ15_22550 [Capnocytophaga catalasegens]GJM53301.1 hypothetical protein RCZ16_16180 [Capnocytophaga catalasegens]